MTERKVVIRVDGGVGSIESAPADVQVEIRDYDLGNGEDDEEIQRDEYGDKYVVTDAWGYGQKEEAPA